MITTLCSAQAIGDRSEGLFLEGFPFLVRQIACTIPPSLPVHAWVIRRRGDRARALLIQRTLPANQVALQTGFAHQSHMARCRKRILSVPQADFYNDDSS